MSKSGKKKYLLVTLAGIVVGFSLLIVFNWAWEKSSLNESCMSCHYHTDSDNSWKQSIHRNSKSGVKTDCADLDQIHIPDPIAQELCAMRVQMERMEKRIKELEGTE